MKQYLYEYMNPERCIVGTVGVPGSREFYLQVSGLCDRSIISFDDNQNEASSEGFESEPATTTIALEKQHTATIAERILQLLTNHHIDSGGTPIPDTGPLDTPFDVDFRLVALQISWDPQARLLVLEAHDHIEGPDDDQDDDWVTTQIMLDADAAAEFARRALAVVSAGRPPCPFCEGPLDPEGHVCPRANGYRR